MPNNENGAAPASAVVSPADRAAAARQSYDEKARSDHWNALPGEPTIGFMELRIGVCRWPINAAHDEEALRYCGCRCEAALSYCKAHAKIAYMPSRPRLAASRNNVAPPQIRAA